MNFEKNKKIIITVFALLGIVILALSIIVIRQNTRLNNGDSSASSEENLNTGNNISDEDSSEMHNDVNSDVDSDTAKSDAGNEDGLGVSGTPVYEISQKSSSSWEQDGKYVAQFDIDFRNNSNESVSDWTLVFDGVEDAEVLTGWNGKFEIKNGQLTVTPESYNGTVDAGTAVNIGVQIIFADEAAAGRLSKTGELYLAGEKVDVSKMVAQDDSKGDVVGNDLVSDKGNSKDDANADEKGNDKSSGKDTTSVNNDNNDNNTSNKKSSKPESGTPFANHGALSVKGTDLVDKSGDKYQLKGVSTHGLAWFPDYVNKDAFQTFRDDWGANVIRLAMYTDENGGYCTDGNKDNLKKLVKNGIDEATELGMYVIVDWHILHDLTPLKYEDEAKKFFEEISSEYKNSDNIIYEICNEPNGGTGWSDIKKYAEDIIPIIRKNDSNAIVVVGTPTWSQDVDMAANDPIKGYDNIMYTLHFYAATHKDDLRKKLIAAKNAGLPIFITEFSICEASGNGSVDYDSADAWFKLINENNLSYCAWNVSNKDEKSSLIKSSVTKKSGWREDDLSETGVWIRQQMK